MKRLVICCDGTWNTPEQEDRGELAPTNVARLRNCVAPADDDTEQLVYYHPGVGTEGSKLKQLAGGAWGAGLGKNIQSAYHWLCHRYETGDEIYLFGFSRGAFTVRSLAGMVGACGLLAFPEEPADREEVARRWSRVRAAYEDGYRERDADWAGDWPRHDDGTPPPIRFLGVWDTVGALGIPDDLVLLNLLDDSAAWGFHDTTLGADVETARQALALDERRASYTPTLWTGLDDGRDVKQMWFSGAHSDVGGGYADDGLSNVTLSWMIEEAAAAGLRSREDMVEQVRPDAHGTVHDSLRGLFKALRSRPRATPHVAPQSPDIHESVVRRQETPPIKQAPYRTTTVLAPGEKVGLDVFARDRWNDSGLYLESGTYELTATGEWLDAKIRCGPGGTRDGNFQPSEVVHTLGSAWGKVEGLFKKITGNDQADFWFTRRVEAYPWFSLVGVVANDAGRDNPAHDGSPSPHHHFLIGDGTTLEVDEPGYFYAYANDAWAMYGNNRGSVRLVVARTG